MTAAVSQSRSTSKMASRLSKDDISRASKDDNSRPGEDDTENVFVIDNETSSGRKSGRIYVIFAMFLLTRASKMLVPQNVSIQPIDNWHLAGLKCFTYL